MSTGIWITLGVVYWVVCAVFMWKGTGKTSLLVPLEGRLGMVFLAPVLVPWVGLACVFDKLAPDNKDNELSLQASGLLLLYIVTSLSTVFLPRETPKAQAATRNICSCEGSTK